MRQMRLLVYLVGRGNSRRVQRAARPAKTRSVSLESGSLVVGHATLKNPDGSLKVKKPNNTESQNQKAIENVLNFPS
jgi:hypothetical protein